MAIIKTHARVKTFPQFPLFFDVTADEWRVARIDPDAAEVAPWNTQGVEFGILFFSNPGVDGPDDGDASDAGADYLLADVRRIAGNTDTAARMQPTLGLWETSDPIYMAVTATQNCIVHAELLQGTHRIVPSGDASGAATAAAQTTAAGARTFTKTSVTWTADDGTAEVEMTLAAGAYWVHAVGWENADDAGSIDFQIHGSTETGFTPGANREEFYTSDAAIAEPNGAYEAFLAPVPITVPAAAKVYWRVIPDAGTTTGALDIYTTPNQ
tara:strand:- start:432 stop:1238 length:807 start_codon:yes stop_codon:yes gene_type:complete